MKKQTFHNTRENRIKTLFKAPEGNLQPFSCGRVAIKLLFIFTLIAAITTWSVSPVESKRPQTIDFGAEKTINVFPTEVQTDDWAGVKEVLVQDLAEDSLYQDFSAKNSAYVPQADYIPETKPQEGAPSGGVSDQISVDPEQAEEESAQGINSTTTAENSIEGTEPVSNEIIDTDTTDKTESVTNAATDNQVNETEKAESMTEDEVESSTATSEPETTESEQTSAESESEPAHEADTDESLPDPEPVSLFDSAKNYLQGAFVKATGLFPLAQQTVTVPLESSTESEETGEVNNEESEVTVEPESDSAADVESAEPESPTDGESSETDTAREEVPLVDVNETPVAAESVTSSTTSESEINENEHAPENTDHTEENLSASATNELVEETQSSSDIPVEAPEATVGSGTENKAVYEIELKNFDSAPLEKGQFITGAQLRLSLAAQLEEPASGTAPYIEVLFGTEGSLEVAGVIQLEDEISNAVNGGYYLFALPTIRDISELDDVLVSLRYHGDSDLLNGMFLDAVWVELDTKIITKDDLRQRGVAENLKHLKAPGLNTLVSDQVNFSREEQPVFNLRYNSQRNALVRGIRGLMGRDLVSVESVNITHNALGLVGVTPNINVTEDGLLTIQIPDADLGKMRPGTYEVELLLNEGGKEFTDTFNFQWGVLSINPNKSEYEIGEQAHISIGALTPSGNTVCEANLDLYITSPEGSVSKVEVQESGLCDGNNVVDVPDFYALATTTTSGTHELYLERLDDDGNVLSFTNDTFLVSPDQKLSIERDGPTRIYPPSPYPMTITVATDDSFVGTLTERVPKDFVINNTTADIAIDGDWQVLTWDISILGAGTEVVSYEFDAPDLSPYLYNLGPASLAEESRSRTITVASTTASTTEKKTIIEGGALFSEHRQWQVASDAVGNMILFFDGPSIPSGWTCLSCGSGTFFQNFVMGSSSYNTTGGTANHNHSVSTSLLTSADVTVESGSGGPAIVSHTHSLTPSVSSETNLPEYRQLQVIQYTTAAGEPPTIPAGAIAIFDVASSSLPANWNRYSAQDGKYVRGENTIGTTGGSNTHTHTVSGIAGPATGGDARSRGGGTQASAATVDHTHTFSTSTDLINNEPPYIEVVLAQAASDVSPTNGLIAMWTEDVAGGWIDVSSEAGDPFSNRFIKASTTYGGTGGGVSHSHSDISNAQTSAPSATITGRTGVSGSSDTHVHNVNLTNFSTTDNLPPYLTAVFGKRQGTGPVYDQVSSRWYVNTNNQTPTDVWPEGATDLTEREPVTATSTPVKDGEVIRLRINAQVTNATSTAGQTFKLQYAAADTCSAASAWYDVGDTSSTTLWRGYDNSSVSDHSTLSSQLLASSTVSATYEENGYATSTPNDIQVDDYGEWDFVLEQNGATAGTNYCFRMTEEDGTVFLSYSHYPQLFVNEAPTAPTLTKLFDNEKTPSSTPWFYFVATDSEANKVHYDIEIDNNYDFSSPEVDKNTISNASLFENQVLISDKAPFNQGELIEFIPDTSLATNTYYWRVRSQDPDGSGQWGDWSEIRSFTIDTTLTASAWFQTTDEQFETNLLSGVATTGSDSVDISGSSLPDVSILDSFSTGNTKTISSGSNRLLVVGIHSEDSATNVDVNTVTYGGQTLTQVQDVQVTTTFSNGMWVGYLDEAGIQAAAGTSIVPTWNGGAPDETILYSSVVFENVDQSNPVPDSSSNSGTTVSTIQPASSISVSDGDIATYFTVSGSGGQTHTPASGYTEGTEQDVNSVAANAYKAITANGTEQPTADWTNLQTRLAIVSLTVAKAGVTPNMTSTLIDFDWGTVGNAWGELQFNDTETVGDIKYQIQYSTTTGQSWALIPDSDLSGNSSGFDTSPVTLTGLNTAVYNDIRVVSVFTDISGSPSLEDWTIEWGYRVETPVITKLFPNEQTGTTTPSFEFSTTDPQSDDLTYQLQWSTTPDFAASTTRTSDTDTGFVNIDLGADTDPFNSGDDIKFTIQPADALTGSTTYWWRVRAKDTTGNNAYSFWTEPQSFTVIPGTSVSTWFQTTEEQFDTDVLSGTIALGSDSVSVATTAVEAMVVYGEGVLNTPRYRMWNGSALSSEGSLLDIGAPLKWSVVKAATTREEYVAATVGTDGDVNAQVFATGEWTDLQEMTTSVGDTNARGFDVTYETLSGDAMVAYCDGDPDPSYYIWDGSSWTSGGTINLSSTNDCEWIQLESDPVSDEIIILSRDSLGSQYEAQVWNGSTWGNSTVQGSMTEDAHEGMALMYEESGGQALIVTSDGNPNRFLWNSWNGTTWGTAATQALGDELEWGKMARDIGSDEIVLCYQDEDSDVGVIRWTGSTWTGQTELDVDGNSKTDPGFACVFEDTAGRDSYILTTLSNTTQVNYHTWNTSTWSAGAQVNSLTDSATMQLVRTGDANILGTFFDDVNDTLNFATWSGSAWTSTEAIETDSSVGTPPYGHPYSITPRNEGTTGTTIVSPSVDFTDGVGPYWKSFSWNDTQPGSSQILYHLQYLNASGTWEFIPDTDLPDNETGTSTGPFDLSNLNTNTYSEIRPYAELSCDGVGNCPTINDWKIEWAGGITVSGTIQEYDESTNVNVGTVAVAVNGVLQSGKTGAVSGGVWSIDNVTVFPGDIITVFVTSAADQNEAVAVARYDGQGNMDGLSLFERHLTIGSNDATTTPFTNSDIGQYDFTNTEDIFFDLNGNNLTVCADSGCADAEFYIKAGSYYTPTGRLLTHDFENNGTFTAGAYSHEVDGSWDNNGTTTMTNSTVVFAATSTTETIDSTGAVTSTFNNLTFGTTTGSGVWNLADPLDVDGDLTVSRGTLARATTSIAVSGDLLTETNGFWTGVGTTTFDGSSVATWADQNPVLQNIGNVVINGTSKAVSLAGNVAAQTITIEADDTLDASVGNYDITVYGDWNNKNNFLARSGEVFFAATSSGQTITTVGDAFYDLSFTGIGGAWSFTESTLLVNNDMTVATGTVTLPTATTTIGGSFDATGGTFAHNNGTILFTANAPETITFDGGDFTNTSRNLEFSGAGSWLITDTNATNTNDIRILQGTVNFPSGVLAIGGTLTDSGGAFNGGSGTVSFYSGNSEVITAGGSTFNSINFDGLGDWSFADLNVDANGDLTISAGSLTLPDGVFTVGGSYSNSASVTPGTGTLTFDSTDTGETVDFGSSSLHDVTFDSVTGGWTLTAPATTTHNFALTNASDWTLASGQLLSVGGDFTNSVGGASTTWTGSTLSLEAGDYSINTKTTTGDAYGTLRVAAGASVSMWNSAATTYVVNNTGSLYSQDHNGIDGDLYIFGTYNNISGTEYWSYATDFDGTDLMASSSERQVNVHLESGASANFTNTTLEVLGDSLASTTIANQGSGTYTINVSGGTTTAQYYDFADLGSTGVSLSDSAVVSVLRDGSYTVAAPGGTALTLSSTTIDTNPGKQIYNVTFATTTAISATNVTQTDGAPASFWWFRNGQGNLYGESYDNDTGDPGSVRFDDSSLVITVSGTVYSDTGTTPITGGTCDGITPVVRVVVDGGTSYTGSCSNVDGTFSVPGVVVIGDPTLTVYLDNASGGEKGSVITRTPTANITNLDIYANRVIVRNEDTDPVSINNMAVYDQSDDTDLQYVAATSSLDTLTVLAGNELFVFASSTFAPGGDITLQANATANSYDGTLYIDDSAIFEAAGTSTYSIGGRLVLGTGASFTAASSTVLMNATTTGKSITSSGEVTFYDLVFNGTGGGWNLGADIKVEGDMTLTAGTVTGTGDITLPNGSLSGNGVLSLGAGTTTLAASNTLGGTSAWTFYNLQLGDTFQVGTTTPVFTSTTTIAGKLLIESAHYLDAGNTNWDLSGVGNVFVENGTFIEDTSTVRYSGAGANVLSTQYYNLDLNAGAGTPTYTATGLGIIVDNDLTVGGDSSTTFDLDAADPDLDVNGDIIIRSNGTLSASDSSDLTLAGSYDNNGTFIGNGGTMTFNGGGTISIAAGGSSFDNVLIAATGDVSVTEHATATDTWILSGANTFTVAGNQALSVGGTFFNAIGGGATTWTNSTLRLYGGNNYSINAATTSDSYGTLEIEDTTQVRMWNSDAGVYNVAGTASLYSQDHAAVDGDLYIWGDYQRTSGEDYWNYSVDFDGSSLSGSERKVDVYLATSSSVSVTGGELSVFGDSLASTTIQAQGTGSYGLLIGGSASSSFQYYEIRDIDSNGLVLTGSPQISTLSYGDLEVSQNGGTAMTVGGMVITANPAKNFTLNRFALNGVASGFNVTATGTSVSSWRFANHYGDIDGEAFDVDPDGDPGYVAWDDSAALITVSGNVYSDEGTTVSAVCDGSTNNVVLRVAGITTYSTSCDLSTGAYSIPNVSYGSSDSLVVYIDGETEQGAAVTKEPVSNIGNLDVYENRVIVRHENANPMTIADMAAWDSSDDVDIPFTAVDAGTDTLTLPADMKLIVWNSKEFAPAGEVTLSGGGAGAAYDGTLQLQTNAVWTGQGTESLAVGGSMILDSGAQFVASNGTTTFTTTGAARTIDVNEDSFNNVAFTGSGSWSITDQFATFGGDVTISAGTVTFPSGTSTFAGSFLNTGGNFDANSGLALFTGTGGEVVTLGGSDMAEVEFAGGNYAFGDTNATTTETLTITSGTITLPSGTLAVGGDFDNTAGTVTHNTAEIIMTNASAATVRASSSDLYAVRFNGGGTYEFADENLTLLDSLFIVNGSVTLASGTLSIGGSFDASGGTFDNASGTILFNSADGGEFIDAGTSDFYNVQISAPTGGYTLLAGATTTNNFVLASVNSFTLQSGAALVVNGVFLNSVGGSNTTWSGSTLVLDGANAYTVNTKSAGGDEYDTLQIGVNSDIRFWNSVATTTTVDTSSSVYSQDHAGVDGSLYIFGDFHISTTTEYWNYATDFDGTDLTGSERAVTVAIEQNATTTLDGGTLQIIGTSGNETTITNQGSGTYAFLVTGGTLNAQYYAYRNLNSAGLNLSGTPTLSSLSYGDFELAVNGGSLITLASTTLNANASKVIVGNRFATTTAITGYNVTLTGVTSNAWTFVSHTGNLDGEDYDVDGATACGSVRWSDSACLLTQQTDYRWRNDDGGIGVPDSEWYSSSWSARQQVRIVNSDATTYSDAVVELLVPYDADMQADFDDLRFTDSDGTTLIPHWVGSSTDSGQAEVWVKVPSLPAEDIATIFMYYNNPTATSSASSTATFIAADDFEDGNITEYSGQTSLFGANSTFNYNGSYGIDNAGNETSRANLGGIFRFDQTVSQGETFRFLQYVDTSAGSGDETCTLFGVQSPGTTNENYAVCLEQFGTDRISLVKDTIDNDSSGTLLASSTISFSTGWYEVEVDWGTDDSLSVAVYDSTGALAATTSATDSTYTSGGFGFTFWFHNGGWDAVSSRPTLTTEPNVYFGAEQADGGASWAAAQNTAAIYSVGDTARLRLGIENSGLSITNQQFLLEYAPLASSPSCEAVDSANYSAVPVQSSCGTSPVCMQTSTFVTNGSATGDLLTALSGAFSPGELREDPSNVTGNLDVGQDEFTELEYVVTPTSNVVDENLCFRVTDNGTEFDTYLRVAQLSLRFDPVVGTVTLNNSQNISLLPGTTTAVYATGTVSDLNGFADLSVASSTIYRSGVIGGAACTPDNNDCYISTTASSCSFTDCAGNSCTVECRSDIYFHADPTDTGSDYEGEEWLAFIEVEDMAGGYDFGSALGVEMGTLRAIDVEGVIDYGSIEVNADTGSYNASTSVLNQGNVAIDLEIVGTDLSDGISSVIPADQQKFATSTFTYSACGASCDLLSSTTPVSLNVDLAKPAIDTPPVSDDVYWGIAIPFGINSAPHQGVNVFTPVSP